MNSTSIIRDVVASYEKQYEELSELWRDAERKSQIALSTSGIVMALVYAFIRNIDEHVGPVEQWLLTLCVVSVGFTVTLCIISLVMQTNCDPPRGDVLALTCNVMQVRGCSAGPETAWEKQAGRYLKHGVPGPRIQLYFALPECTDEKTFKRYLVRHAEDWRNVTAQFTATFARKSSFVSLSYLGVFISVALLGIAAIFRTFIL